MIIKNKLEVGGVDFDEARGLLRDELAKWVKKGWKPVSDAAFSKRTFRGHWRCVGVLTVAKSEEL